MVDWSWRLPPITRASRQWSGQGGRFRPTPRQGPMSAGFSRRFRRASLRRHDRLRCGAELVAYTPDRVNERCSKLSAQSMDKDFHGVAGNFLVPAVHRLLDLRACENLVLATDEKLQDRVLATCESHRLSVNRDGVTQ